MFIKIDVTNSCLGSTIKYLNGVAYQVKVVDGSPVEIPIGMFIAF